MIRPRTEITFTQMPNDGFPTRSGSFVLNFVNSFECEHSWKNLTNTAKIIFPKNVILQTPDGSRYDLSSHRETGGKNIVAGGTVDNQPFLMRGDKVTVKAGYYYYDAADNEIVPDLVTIYEGFVTVIKLKMPIEVTCEDNMYLLKQVLVPPELRLFSAETSIEEIATKLVDYVNLQKGTSLTVHDAPAGVRTYAGAYRVVGNVTVAQVLDDFRSHMKINSWFRGDALHCSAIAYFPDEANPVNPIFVFQQNIIDDSLNYTRLDDVRLGATVYTVQQEEQTTTNKNGHAKTKMKRLETTVGDPEGEQRTIIVYSKPGEVTTVAQLKAQGEAQLKRFKYEGFVGEFTTFGEPVVNHGDTIELWDNILPERNGVYFVSSVARSTGVNGYRQKIKLDIKVSGVNDINITPEQIAKGV